MKHLQRANHVQRKLAKINDNNLKTKWKLKTLSATTLQLPKQKKTV